MRVKMELSAQEVRTAIQNWLVANKPHIVKGYVIKILLNSGKPATEPAAYVELDPQPGQPDSHFKD